MGMMNRVQILRFDRRVLDYPESREGKQGLWRSNRNEAAGTKDIDVTGEREQGRRGFLGALMRKKEKIHRKYKDI